MLTIWWIFPSFHCVDVDDCDRQNRGEARQGWSNWWDSNVGLHWNAPHNLAYYIGPCRRSDSTRPLSCSSPNGATCGMTSSFMTLRSWILCLRQDPILVYFLPFYPKHYLNIQFADLTSPPPKLDLDRLQLRTNPLYLACWGSRANFKGLQRGDNSAAKPARTS